MYTKGLATYPRANDAYKRYCRSWKVHTKYSFWVVPNRPGFAGVHTEDTSIFRDSKSVGFGHRQRLISLASLKDPTNGYVNEDGEVTVQASVTITAPPELESPEETSSIAEQPLPVTGVPFDLKPAMNLQPLFSV
ncbi:hypothetical protein BaRGS_00020818 [Batillaria attramentaria]|uniref:Uncharacterized protein n=1 Tax=Batillaria attramentaria TaxID=370345 RepID=A0ABD0KLZ8_9CAEN